MTDSATIPDEPERWLDVVGYEGWYEVSSLGRVQSVTRRIPVEMPYGLTFRTYRGRMLKQTANAGSHWYLTVGLARNSDTRTWPVHQLVAAAFIGPCPPGQEVRHGPNGKLDNRATELSYGTKKENFADRVRDHGTIRGEKSGQAKLTWDDVVTIRRRAAEGVQQRTLAAEYEVCFQNIHLIVARKTWLYPPEEW
jgi:NUMOD4 motif-containing protein/HNH endonuclease